jgi:hypothetical protein
MREIDALRKQYRWFAGQAIGVPTNDSRVLVAHVGQQVHLSEIANLPQSKRRPIQDTNPDSATFGKFYFMLGISRLGGGDPLG